MKRTKFVPLVLCVAVSLSGLGSASAKENGFPSDSCAGCHRGGGSFKPRITADKLRVEPGESVLLTLHVPATNGSGAGLYFTSNNKGKFEELAGEGLRIVSGTTLTHTSPKAAQGAESTFRVRWTAPDAPGGAMFDLTAVSSNRDGGTRGDSEGLVRFNLSIGCDGVDGYLDQDGDGWGIPDLRGPTRLCELGTMYSLKAGDCNDYDKRANPMGREICNLYDDDCDGMTNEGLETETVFRDADGDGYGSTRSEATMGCPAGGFGFSSTRDDCDDTSKMIHPGVKETCNNRDDDCNSRVDDGARASCGEGWCRRLAPSCDPLSCQPGLPRAEMCNAFDDDCDGVADNGPNLCGEGKVCYKGACLTNEAAAEVKASEPDAGPDAGSATNAPAGTGGASGGGATGAAGAKGSTTVSTSGETGALGCTVAGSATGASRVAGGAPLVVFGAVWLLLARRRRRT